MKLWNQMWCDHCGTWLPLGPANDEPEAVKVEIRAAELAAEKRIPRDAELFGWRYHAAGLYPYPDEVVGYLARAIATHGEAGE